MTISHNSKDIVPGALIVLATTKKILCLVLGEVRTKPLYYSAPYYDTSISFIGLDTKFGLKEQVFLQSSKGKVYGFLIHSPDYDQENSE